MFEGGFEVLDDFLGENIGIWEIVGFFEAFVSEPEDVEAGPVAVNQLFVIVRAPAAIWIFLGPSRRPLMPILRIITLDELVEVFTLQWISLQREVLVRP